MSITRPTFIIDKARCVRNIQLMANKALRNGLIFRPHFKTHQSAEVAQLFRDAGVSKAAVSSVTMAQYFVSHGWSDITIAFPVNLLEIDGINQLAEQIQLNILLESLEAAEFVSKHLRSRTGVFLELDCGYGRTGMDPGDEAYMKFMIDTIDASEMLSFKGFLTHAGHSYNARSHKEIMDTYRTSVEPLKNLKEDLRMSHPDIIISYGDTPTASVVEDFAGIDELRPGNFVYYDLTQWQISSCGIEDIAVTVECPIVSIHPDRGEMIIYGGGVHFSKDRLELKDGEVIYGIPVQHNGRGWDAPYAEAFLTKISQEHGTIKMKRNDLEEFTVGDTIKILPVHSCMTADLLKNQYLIV